MTFARFDWSDPFQLSGQLSEEETMVQQTARSYAREELMPRVLEANRHETFDRKIMSEMGELGLLVSWACLRFFKGSVVLRSRHHSSSFLLLLSLSPGPNGSGVRVRRRGV